MSYLDRIRSELASLRARDLLRTPRRRVPAGVVDFSSNDYLGLRVDPSVRMALAETTLVGSGGSRLLAGASEEHARLEDDLATWLGRGRALLFSSGYLAAIGAIATLARAVDVAYSDEFVHACAIDGLRLTKLPRRIVAHRSTIDRSSATDAALVVTDSLYGMDGTRAPLDRALRGLGPRDALLVDEAHALGTCGLHGSGLASHLRDERVVVIGTLSKAFGCAGGFVAGPADAIALLASTARTFVFDTAAPPSLLAAASAALAIVRDARGDALRARLDANVAHARARFAEIGIALPDDPSPIVPIPIGSERDALGVAERLAERGIFAPAIRPPTVPRGTSRLRVTLRADHTEGEIDRLGDAVRDALPRTYATAGSADR